MIYILTDRHRTGGTETWLSNLCYNLDKLEKTYIIIRDELVNTNINSEDTIILNNYHCNINDNIVNQIYNLNTQVYFVVHSDICPSNYYLIKYINIINNVIFVSEPIKTKLKEKLLQIKPTLNLFVLTNVVQTNVFLSDLSFSARSNKKATIFNFVGRISQEKNIPMLLYALAQIDKPNWILNIYGDTYNTRYYEIIKNIIKSLDLSNNVNLCGFVQDKLHIYTNCDYVVLPSVSEGSSYTILESLAFGTPVIACLNVGDNNDKITNGVSGYLIDLCGIDNINNINNINNDKIYANDYHEILKSVGYLEAVLMQDYDGDGYISMNSNRIIVPPNLYNRRNDIFDSNVTKVKDVLINSITNKLTIKPIIFSDENKQLCCIKNMLCS